LLEHSFVSDVSSRCPCLAGPDLSWLLITCWNFFYLFLFLLFSLRLLYVCVVNALINGEIEDHVSFEDRWMVASWCDE
jgi:hypothetical protein